MTSPIRRPSSFLACLLLAALLAACGGNDDEGGGQPFTMPEDTQPGTADVIQAGPLKGYYFEASVKPLVRLTNGAHFVIKGWYQSSGSTRWDIASSDPAFAEFVRQVFVVGDEVLQYEPGTNTYTLVRDPGLSGRLNGAPFPLFSNYQLGLVPAVLATARKAGADTLLGRDVDLYESGTATQQATFWVDREYGFVLRQVVKSSDPAVPSFDASVEKVQFNPRLGPQTFVFTPPAGARNGSATPQSSGFKATHGPLNVPSGFLSPPALPTGYTLASSSQTASGGVTSYIERRLSGPEGATITLSETYRPGGLPDQSKTSTNVPVRGSQGYTARTVGGTILIFYDADTIVLIEASALSLNDLRRFAESMVVAP